MSNLKFAAGVVLAGALAFGGAFAAMAVTAPMLHGIPADSSSGQNEPTEEEPVDEHSEDQLEERPHADSPVGEGDDPEDLLPPHAALLIGEWRAKAPANQDAFVEFNEYGLWTASDGCNSSSGSWSVDPDGSFHGEGGPMTQIGCDNVNIPTAVSSAAQIEVSENDELTLTDENGEEMLLVRASTDAFTLEGSWTHNGDDVSTVKFTSTGEWVGTIGCAEFTGTWMLGVRNVPVLEDGSADPSAPILLSGPGSLVIGAEPTQTNTTCEGAPEEFVLKYGAEYLFSKGPGDRFLLIEATEFIDPEATEFNELEFVRS